MVLTALLQVHSASENEEMSVSVVFSLPDKAGCRGTLSIRGDLIRLYWKEEAGSFRLDLEGLGWLNPGWAGRAEKCEVSLEVDRTREQELWELLKRMGRLFNPKFSKEGATLERSRLEAGATDRDGSEQMGRKHYRKGPTEASQEVRTHGGPPSQALGHLGGGSENGLHRWSPQVVSTGEDLTSLYRLKLPLSRIRPGGRLIPQPHERLPEGCTYTRTAGKCVVLLISTSILAFILRWEVHILPWQ